MSMSAEDWQNMARVYDSGAGALEGETDSPSLHQKKAYRAMAARCRKIAHDIDQQNRRPA